MVTVTPSMTPTFLTFDFLILFDFQVSLLIHQLLVPVKILKPPKDQETDPNRFEWTKRLQLEVQLKHDFLDESGRVVTCCDPSKTCLSEKPFSRRLSLCQGATSFVHQKWGNYAGSWMFPPISKKGMLWASHIQMGRGPSDLAPGGGSN